MSQSIERRIHAAIRSNKGIRFSADELWHFVVMDRAIATKVANKAAEDAGNDPPGDEHPSMWSMSWKQLGWMSGDHNAKAEQGGVKE